MTLFRAPTSAVRDRKSKQLPPSLGWDQDVGNLGMPARPVLLKKEENERQRERKEPCMAALVTYNPKIPLL